MSAAHDTHYVWSGSPTIALMDQIDQGLPLAELDRLAAQVAPNDKTFKYQFVTRPTYARRKAQGARHGRAHVVPRKRRRGPVRPRLGFAVKVWGNEESAREFLTRRHMLLAGRTPLSVILSGETGGQMVEHLLGRLAYGSAV